MIRFRGRDITAMTSAQIARAGLVRTFQQTRVYREMTCMDNMRISFPAGQFEPGLAGWLRPPSALADDDSEELLDFVGLREKRTLRAGELSFGQQKLLELAMALVARPALLLLDEPTAGINPTLINGVLSRLRAVNKRFGATLLVIEHNMRVIMNLAGRIYCMAHGKVLAEGAAREIQGDRRVIDAYLGGAMMKTDAGCGGAGAGSGADNISVEAVSREAERLAENRPTMEELVRLAGGDFLRLEGFRAGYGKIEILHGVDLALARGKALCLIGPNGAGKSTVLHGLYGLADCLGGRAVLDGREIGGMAAERKLSGAGNGVCFAGEFNFSGDDGGGESADGGLFAAGGAGARGDGADFRQVRAPVRAAERAGGGFVRGGAPAFGDFARAGDGSGGAAGG